VDVAGNVAEWVAPDPGDSPTSSICRGGAWRLTKAQEGEGIPPSVALDLGRSWEWQRQPTRERRASNAIRFRVALETDERVNKPWGVTVFSLTDLVEDQFMRHDFERDG